jgi:hypothetical protein
MLGSFASAFVGWFNGTNFNLDLFYAINVIQEHYACLIVTWSDHPGKPYNHKAYGSALAE